MKRNSVIAIFDIGRTNKKLILFDVEYNIVFERSTSLHEITDEDNFPCESLDSLRLFVFDSLKEMLGLAQFDIKAINFSAYGASLVYLDKNGEVMTPLYNYLKPFPEWLGDQFYKTYDPSNLFTLETASPKLGNLNSGLQLYRLKYEKPGVMADIKYALHLPQYMSCLLSGKYYSELTSIGCHTALWNFERSEYHAWIQKENLIEKFAPIIDSQTTFDGNASAEGIKIGTGVHDSSSALIPYLLNFTEPFVLISTGTWCISLNPFNDAPLTSRELEYGSLYYMTFKGCHVKASRLLSGLVHNIQVKKIAEYFHVSELKLKQTSYSEEVVKMLRLKIQQNSTSGSQHNRPVFPFDTRPLGDFSDGSEAYHQLMMDLAVLQYHSTRLVLQGASVRTIFVDGGFSENNLFMNLLSELFPDVEVFSASMTQATAMGAALVIHKEWNTRPILKDNIVLKRYPSSKVSRA